MPPQRQIPPASPPMRRAVINFPTPVISDQIIQEFVSTETGDYTILPYGTRYNQVQHTSFQKGRDNYYLVFQGPADNSGWVVQRIWANDRTDQDSYNFAISYMSENPDYLQIVRTYVYPRDQYGVDKDPSVGPLPPLTPDPEYPDSLLVQEQMAPDVGEQLNSRYVRVTRVFQRLPGPITQTYDFDPSLNVLTVTDRQSVLADDIFQPEYNLLTLEMRESPQSMYVKSRIHSYLQALPPAFNQFETGSFPFPDVLTGISWTKIDIADNPDPFDTSIPLPRSEVRVVPNIRPGPSTPAIFEVITSYFTSNPGTETIYAINPNNLFYTGIAVQMNISRVLNDAINLSVSFTGDGRYADAEDTYTHAASIPTATDYLAAINTFQTVGVDITRWRGSIWVKQIRKVQLL